MPLSQYNIAPPPTRTEYNNKVGTGTLNTTAQNLVGAVNELNSKIATRKYVKGTDYTLHSSINNNNTYCSIAQIGNIIVVSLAFEAGSAIPIGAALVTFTQPLPAHEFARAALVSMKSNPTYRSIPIGINGTERQIFTELAVDNGMAYDGQMIIVLK